MSHTARTTRPPRWSIDLPALAGRRAVVTGASDGVGLEIARGLARAGAEVVMPVRSAEKGAQAAERIRETVPEALLSLRSLDLASLASTAALADGLVAERIPIDILVLNAGIVLLKDPERHLSQDGIELHLQTNMLAHAALVAGLLPLLRGHGARVVLQCSLAARHGALTWDDLHLDRGYRPMRAYAASKVALGLFGVELARRSAASGWDLTTVLCHPGVAMTNIAPAAMREQRTLGSRIGGLLFRWGLGQSAAEAALPALYAATSPDARDTDLVVPSRTFELSGPPARRSPYRALRDPEDAARVWDLVPALTGVRFPAAADGAELVGG